MAKNSLMEGRAFPEDMLLIYPLLCPKSLKLPAEFQCVLQGVGFMGILCNTGWERKMPGFDCVIAMVDANVHGFTHPFLLVVENLRFLLS